MIHCVDISWDNSLGLWTYTDNRGGFPLEADRHYLQQRRLWTEDKVDFELGGTSNVAANETSKDFSLAMCVIEIDVADNELYGYTAVKGSEHHQLYYVTILHYSTLQYITLYAYHISCYTTHYHVTLTLLQ